MKTPSTKFQRKDVEFATDEAQSGGKTMIRGWLYMPEPAAGAAGPAPVVAMAAGFSIVKEMHADKFAEAFAGAGMAVLLFDFRNLGASGLLLFLGARKRRLYSAAQA